MSQDKLRKMEITVIDKSHLRIDVHFNEVGFGEHFHLQDTPSGVANKLRALSTLITDHFQTRDAELTLEPSTGDTQAACTCISFPGSATHPGVIMGDCPIHGTPLS